MSIVSSREVELSVNVYEGDMDFVDATYRHVLGQLAGRPDVQRLVVDRSTPSGRFSASSGERRLDACVSRLLDEGLVDAVTDVDWGELAVRRTMERYFGDPAAPTRCSSGTPIYQYLAAIDACASPYLLHLDSDMLLHLGDGARWIDEGIDHIQQNRHVAIVTPEGGPPNATSTSDWIRGPRRTDHRQRWHASEGVSTRIFLMDVQRFRSRAVPLVPAEPGETLERTLTHTFHLRGLERHSLNDDHNYALHPRRHNENHRRYLPGLIALVESGRAPYRRTGFRWDMRTEGRHFAPWWLAIQRERLWPGR
jgi:hypothetical protein